MSIRSSVDDQVEILFVLFHQIFFPGKFFQRRTVIHQILGECRIFPDLIKVKLLFLVQDIEFFLQMITGQQVIAVEKDQPNNKCNRCQEVFIDQNR